MSSLEAKLIFNFFLTRVQQFKSSRIQELKEWIEAGTLEEWRVWQKTGCHLSYACLHIHRIWLPHSAKLGRWPTGFMILAKAKLPIMRHGESILNPFIHPGRNMSKVKWPWSHPTVAALHSSCSCTAYQWLISPTQFLRDFEIIGLTCRSAVAPIQCVVQTLRVPKPFLTKLQKFKTIPTVGWWTIYLGTTAEDIYIYIYIYTCNLKWWTGLPWDESPRTHSIAST